MLVASTPDQIEYVNLARCKSAIKLEKVGLKSRGGSIRKMMAIKMGLKSNASHDQVIEAIQNKMNEMLAK